MATIDDLINESCFLNHSSSDYYSDTEKAALVKILTRYRNNIIKLIQDRTNCRFFYDYFTATTISWQNQYNNIETNKILWVEVRYKTNWEYIRLTPIDPFQWPETIEYYRNSQSETNPHYEIRNQSVYIYPAPQEDVIDWIIMYWENINIPDLSLTTDLTEIWLWEIKWEELVLQKALDMIMTNERQDENLYYAKRDEFMTERRAMLKRLRGRVKWPQLAITENISNS